MCRNTFTEKHAKQDVETWMKRLKSLSVHLFFITEPLSGCLCKPFCCPASVYCRLLVIKQVWYLLTCPPTTALFLLPKEEGHTGNDIIISSRVILLVRLRALAETRKSRPLEVCQHSSCFLTRAVIKVQRDCTTLASLPEHSAINGDLGSFN